jgi:hypothetical protein
LDVLDGLISDFDSAIKRGSVKSEIQAKNVAMIAMFLSDSPIFFEEFWLKILSFV